METASFVVQFSVKPSASRVDRSASASIAGVVLFTFMNTLLVLSMPLTFFVLTALVSKRAELPSVDPSEAPMPKRACPTGLTRVTSWKLVRSTALGRKPTPAIAWLAGAPPVVFRKLPGLTFSPLSASEKTRAPFALVALVKLTVNPSASIDTQDAFFWTARALLNE